MDIRPFLLSALADRLAEAFAERNAHEKVRKDYWGLCRGRKARQ